MTYSLVIEKYQGDSKYILDLKTWESVLDVLKNNLDSWVIRVMISKYSKDYRLLGLKSVTMHNFYRVVTSKSDKEVFV